MPLNPEKFVRFVRLLTAAMKTSRYRPAAGAVRSPPRPPSCSARGVAVPPTPIEYDRFAETVACDDVRTLFRPTPAGRSLNSESLLSSKPVVMLYGVPVLPARVTLALRLRNAWELMAIA